MPLDQEMLIGSVLAGLSKGVAEGLQFRAELDEKKAARMQAAELDEKKLQLERDKLAAKSDSSILADTIKSLTGALTGAKIAGEKEDLLNSLRDRTLNIVKEKANINKDISELDRRNANLILATDPESVTQLKSNKLRIESYMKDLDHLSAVNDQTVSRLNEALIQQQQSPILQKEPPLSIQEGPTAKFSGIGQQYATRLDILPDVESIRALISAAENDPNLGREQGENLARIAVLKINKIRQKEISRQESFDRKLKEQAKQKGLFVQ